MITKYRVCMSGDLPEFHRLMDQSIYEGWQPYGNLQVIPQREGEEIYYLYVQAVVMTA